MLLVGAADLPDQDDGARVAIGLEGGEAVDEIGADDRVAPDADAGGLPQAVGGELVDDLVGEGAAAAHHADVSRLADVARNDADLAPSGRDQAGTVRTDEPGATLAHERHHLRHVEHRHAFGDTHDERQPGVGGFENGRGREGSGHVDDGRIGAGRLHRFGHGIEDRDLPLECLAALARRDAGDDLGAVLQHLLGVERAVAAGDALDEQPGALVDEDAHAAFPFPAAATACLTASSMSVSAENPAPVRIRIASCSFVPVRRITMGTFRGNWLVACTMPLATSSQRVMPPKMLNRMARTPSSAVMILRALTTF